MTKILDLTKYDLVFTTSFEHTHGVSGHLYEMIECFYLCRLHGINAAILLSDGTTTDTFIKSVTDKYSFTQDEQVDMFARVVEAHQPRLIRSNNLCIVDGSARLNGCVVYANNMFLLRCWESNFDYFNTSKTIKQTHLLQDFNLYPERFEDSNLKVVDYVKKVLWSKYKPVNTQVVDTALFYLTTNCRVLPKEEIQSIMDKFTFDHYLIITNEPSIYKDLECDKVSVELTPVINLFDKFNAYIYTSTPRQMDCSPRFIVECAAANKPVHYVIDYFDKGIQCRIDAINKDINSVLLQNDDYFVNYVKQYIY
jgi:hypothetical protein